MPNTALVSLLRSKPSPLENAKYSENSAISLLPKKSPRENKIPASPSDLYIHNKPAMKPAPGIRNHARGFSIILDVGMYKRTRGLQYVLRFTPLASYRWWGAIFLGNITLGCYPSGEMEKKGVKGEDTGTEKKRRGGFWVESLRDWALKNEDENTWGRYCLILEGSRLFFFREREAAVSYISAFELVLSWLSYCGQSRFTNNASCCI